MLHREYIADDYSRYHARRDMLAVCGMTLFIRVHEDLSLVWYLEYSHASRMCNIGLPKVPKTPNSMAGSGWRSNVRRMTSGSYYPCDPQPRRQNPSMLRPGIVGMCSQ